uniref:Uncharacterized protein n=1 Tax=Anguilla anguilla TaxID=7936 RepID=A0A0E9PP81_ANGAN
MWLNLGWQHNGECCADPCVPMWPVDV